MRPFRSLLVLAVLPLQASLAQTAVKWGPAPAVFPKGAKMAVLQGDPGKPDLFTVRLDMPNGYRVAPHFHPTDEHITVISGNFLVGMGDKIDTRHAISLHNSQFITAPAQAHHWAVAKGHTVVQVHAIGPFQLSYVNPADDPSKKTVAKK